ncbi:MAG: peptidylprolyl isomerase [Anaerolineae bacterium]|jgi:FKBP-type peptidyl-prolyl cis-trans isomerase SlyD|nr:peptidylprolyl isomerase [Anaerolineae bacterium]MBT4310482.1 peptidylprolyl isomerase [Anaerolineae bacterium]MBT4459234.1 peptidylprolyl isomerase [Anaerolineae bacterium]MBT4841052.1 peptidylprolyl isomerase [Anaerolineae bacterium]MBT6060623.1 peptidylprolyl isomerase [Anaerolineae bacterium]
MTEEKKVKKNLVIAIDYTLTVDGEEIDSSKGREPLEFLQGKENIIPGLEREMLGMEIGESKDVVVAPEDGYGLTDEEAYMEVPANQFPKNIPVEVGTELQVENEEGQPAYARIEHIENNMALLNFNHPLAGKELLFSVKVVALRDPSEEELSHGHVHHEDHNH